MHSPSQQSCKIKIITYTEEEPKAQKDSHPPCPAAVLPLRSQYQSLINASRQRLRIVPSLPGDWTGPTRVWDLKHSQGHGPGLTVWWLLPAVVVEIKFWGIFLTTARLCPILQFLFITDHGAGALLWLFPNATPSIFPWGTITPSAQGNSLHWE